jgi:hypothetical protein
VCPVVAFIDEARDSSGSTHVWSPLQKGHITAAVQRSQRKMPERVVPTHHASPHVPFVFEVLCAPGVSAVRFCSEVIMKIENRNRYSPDRPMALVLLRHPPMHIARRVLLRTLVLFLVWCVTLHAPAVCILHCQVMPWVQQLMIQPLPLFVCDFGERTLNSDTPAPSSNHLPEIVHPIVLATLLLIEHVLLPISATSVVQERPRYQPLPPLTPPPRSGLPFPGVALHLLASSTL